MKKLITLIALLAIAGVATADIVDGDFSGTGFVSYIVSGALNTSHLDNGWYVGFSGDPNAWHYDAATDSVSRGTGATGSRSFAQCFTSSLTGNQTIKIQWAMVDADDSSDNRVSYAVYGVNNGTGTGMTDFDIASWSFGATVDTGSTATKLADWRRHNVDSADYTADIDIAVDFGTGYDSYYIGFSTFNMNAGDSVTVTDINIVPEPATVGMLGLGALVAMLVRRIRA